jgi:hypothetical protein
LLVRDGLTPVQAGGDIGAGASLSARRSRIDSSGMRADPVLVQVLAGTESADHTPEEMPERHDHGRILSEQS